MIAAGAWMSVMFLPTNCSFSAVSEGGGYREGAVGGVWAAMDAILAAFLPQVAESNAVVAENVI